MAEITTVNVGLGDRSYPIKIGSGLLSSPELIKPYIEGRQVCIISNVTVAPLYLEVLKSALCEFELSEIILADGEEHKNLETVSEIYDQLLRNNFERSGTLIALGGGVVGDMVGFVAATYMRGISFIQIPTTLLAQVDSSVGGKTGVNRPLGKNMVGAFYQPKCVIADTDTLNTLEDKELYAGLAEVIKYGAINNLHFFNWLKDNINGLVSRNIESMVYAIKVSCEEKAKIVAEDEKEVGIRAILNFGHTFGHAIESAMGYGKWLHGEAVATGMVMAADLSVRVGLLSLESAQEIKSLLSSANLPVVPPEEIDDKKYLALMAKDKKNEMGKIRFVLLEGIGKAVITKDVEKNILKQTLNAGVRLVN